MSAEQTARSSLLDALVRTSDVTGLRAGPASEKLIDALVETIRDPRTAWAFAELAGGTEQETS